MKSERINNIQPIQNAIDAPIPDVSIQNFIHPIRGRHVILDSDLANLYGVETKALNQAVKRNIDRFPDDFMFQLTKEECLRSQIVTLNTAQGKHLKYMPHAFTENGVAMLSSVLKSKAAIEVNINIMRAFTAMRSFMAANTAVFNRIEALEHHHILIEQHQSETDKKIDELLQHFEKNKEKQIQGFLYDGQFFDGYYIVSELIRSATHRIILIDNYVDERVLNILTKREKNVSATIYTNPRNSQIEKDLLKHNAQYPPIELKKCSNCHDRFLILDDRILFVGGSIKDLGKKIIAFSEIHLSPNDIISKLKE